MTATVTIPAATSPAFSDIVELLTQPRSYAERPLRVDVLETHISCVFLTDRLVYKLKKPVRFEFLDFTTAARRKRACEDEVRLNRRLAPGVYRHVLPITVDNCGRLRLAGRGRPIDWVVQMRRLPADRMLDHLIRTGRLTDADVAQLAATLANFYQQVPPLTLEPHRYRDTLQAHIAANRQELLNPDHELPPAMVHRAHSGQMRLLKLAPEVLDRRVCDGRIIQGHGDLRPEHVCLEYPPVVFDCIEFSESLRQIDVVDELSFLTMECDILGTPEVGRRLLSAYCRTSGDRPPKPLLGFYKCYRACVRAKVSALRGMQMTGPASVEARQNARRYLRKADEYARGLGRPLLIIIRGLSGTGKSTLAAAVSKSLGTEMLSTDAIRRELLGASDSGADFGAGHYTLANRLRVYEEMFRRAGRLLDDGLPVVLDGTFPAADLRLEAAALGRAAGAASLVVHCHCPEEIALGRIRDRAAVTNGHSEARAELYPLQKQHEEADAVELNSLEVETTACLPTQVEDVFQALARLDPFEGWSRSAGG